MILNFGTDYLQSCSLLSYDIEEKMFSYKMLFSCLPAVTRCFSFQSPCSSEILMNDVLIQYFCSEIYLDSDFLREEGGVETMEVTVNGENRLVGRNVAEAHKKLSYYI